MISLRWIFISFKRHAFLSWFIFTIILMVFATLWMTTGKIDCRFLYMVDDLQWYGVHPTPTVNGVPYPDYPVTYFLFSEFFSFLKICSKRFVLSLPSVIFCAYIIGMIALLGEKVKRNLGHFAAALTLSSYEFLIVFTGFGIDAPVCAAGITLLYVFHVKKDCFILQHVVFFLLAAFVFSMRTMLGAALLGVGAAAICVMRKQWFFIVTFALLDLFCVIMGLYFFYKICQVSGGQELWNLVMEWQIGNRIIQKDGDSLFYLVKSYGMYAPASFPLLYTILFGRKKILQHPLCEWIAFVLAIEIFLTIPDCQHLRYMTIAVPAITLSGIYGVMSIECPNFLYVFIKKFKSHIMKMLVFWHQYILPLSYPMTIVICLFLNISISFTTIIIGFIFHILLWIVYHSSKKSLITQWVFILLSVSFLMLFQISPDISAHESSFESVNEIERIRGNSLLFFWNIDPDHDGMKYLCEIPRSKTRDIFFVDNDVIEDKKEDGEDIAKIDESIKTAKSRLKMFLHKILHYDDMDEKNLNDYVYQQYQYIDVARFFEISNDRYVIVRDKKSETENLEFCLKKNNIRFFKDKKIYKLGHRYYNLYHLESYSGELKK